jgi:uracil-DNA glycosylase
VFNDICPKIGVETEKKAKMAASRKGDKRPLKKATASKTDSSKADDTMTDGGKPSGKGAGAGSLKDLLPPDWRKVLAAEFDKPYFKELEEFVTEERGKHEIFPPPEDVFNAFKSTPYDKVKVLLLGQDPYHDVGQAHGMCFSVKPGVKPPPSLVNMFKELNADLGCKIPNNGYLVPWAERGVMLLNAVLTVRAHTPASHASHGWETFTDAVIRALNDRADPVVFLLWGGYAQKKQKLIDATKHRVIMMAHPSPLSQAKFMGSRPYSAVNKALKELGKGEIDWQIPDL